MLSDGELNVEAVAVVANHQARAEPVGVAHEEVRRPFDAARLAACPVGLARGDCRTSGERHNAEAGADCAQHVGVGDIEATLEQRVAHREADRFTCAVVERVRRRNQPERRNRRRGKLGRVEAGEQVGCDRRAERFDLASRELALQWMSIHPFERPRAHSE